MANNNIIKILIRKFNDDDAKALASEIDQQIKRVAFELIKENLCVTGSDPYARLHWNKQTLDHATFKDSKHLNPEVETDEQKRFRGCWLDFTNFCKKGK